MRVTNSILLVTSLCSSLIVVTALAPNSWQKRLDKALLDVDGARNSQSRIRLIQRALQDKKFKYDVQRGFNSIRSKGFGKGHPKLIEALWPEGTIARDDLDGIQALIKTLPERFEELRSSDTSLLNVVQSTSDGLQPQIVVTNVVQKAFEERGRAVTLAQNVFRRNPKEVDILKSKRLAVIEGNNATVDIRQFDDYTAVSVDLTSYESFTLTNMGEGLAKLSSYVLGYNNDEQSSEMTAPFIMQSSKMWIKQPNNMYGVEPKDPSVQIEDRAGETYALLEFPGICTNAEVDRRKEILQEALLDQNYTIADNTMVVLQYNSPGTLPWRRKNQIGFPVKEIEVVAVGDDEENDVEAVADQTKAVMEEEESPVESTTEEEAVVESEDTPTEVSSTTEEEEESSENKTEEG